MATYCGHSNAPVEYILKEEEDILAITYFSVCYRGFAVSLSTVCRMCIVHTGTCDGFCIICVAVCDSYVFSCLYSVTVFRNSP